MKVLIVSSNPDNTVQYLNQAGYEALPVYANDMVVMLAQQKNVKVAVYFQPFAVPESHEKVLKEMLEARIRVILVAPREERIVPYAAALGVYDLLSLPVNNEDLINAIENPGDNFKAAEWVNGGDYNIKADVEEENHEKKGLIERLLPKGKISDKEQPAKSRFRLPVCAKPKACIETSLPKTVSKDDKDTISTILKSASQNLKLSLITNNELDRAFVVSVISPWIPNIGTTRLAINLAKYINANLFDADFHGRGLGVRLGISPADMWEYDWRDGANPVIFNNEKLAWTLDPHVVNSDNELSQRMQEIIRQSAGSNLVIDAGSDPLAWYAKSAIEQSDIVCIPLVADPLLMARAIPRWRKKFAINKPAVIALIGDGDAAEISGMFGLPAIKLPGVTGNLSKLINELISFANAGTVKPQITVYLAGHFEPIDVNGIHCGVYPDSFGLWKAVEANGMPDALIFQSSSGIEQLIGELRRDNYQLPIAIIGSTDEKYYNAGADACYENLTPDCIRDLFTRSEHTRRTNEMAQTDELTGCYRKAMLATFIEKEARRNRMTGETFSILICDLDNFKQVNDQYGHPVGDLVLKRFGSFLRSNTRHSDKVVRYGGEEFAVILPKCDIGSAFGVAGKLRQGWEENCPIDVGNGKSITVTFSGGIADVNNCMDAPIDIIDIADRALYKAKAAGRNLIMKAK